MKLIKQVLQVMILISSGSLLGATYSPQFQQEAPGSAIREFDKFLDLRKKVIDIIGASKSRLIISTNLLTDGHISSALYLAKYRKVKVNVFLDKNSAGVYLSRLRFLKAQGISVMDRPAALEQYFPTLIMQDTRLFKISRDLDVLKPEGGKLVAASPKELKAFVASLTKVFKGGAQLVPSPLVHIKPKAPKRGRRRYRSSEYYNYDQSTPSRRPSGVPTKLPKATILQKRRSMGQDQNTLERSQIKNPNQPLQGDGLP